MRFDRLEPLGASEIHRIHSATMDVLANSGMLVTSERALDLFRRHGIQVDNQIVRLTEADVEKALKCAPEGFVWMARDPEKSIYVGGDSYAFGPSGMSPFVTTREGVQRSSNLRDLEDFLRLTQMVDVINFNREAVTPNDVPEREQSLRSCLSAILLTDKPYSGMSLKAIRLLCIAYGIDEGTLRDRSLAGKAYGVGGINPMSPLMLSADQADRLMDLAHAGIPSIVASMPTAGVTAPCTLPGVLVLQNAEQLACLVLSQLAGPGVGFVYGCISTIANMRTGSAAIGAPEARLLEHGSAQLARFYGLPARGDGGLTDAFSCDFQAGAESALHYSSVVRAGVHLIPGCGELASWNSASLEKFVLDAENIRYVRRLVTPMEVDRDTMAVEVIREVGPRGEFMSHPHTFGSFRTEFLYPSVFARSDYDSWAKAGREEALDRAHREVNRLLQEYERPDIDPSVERDLERYVKTVTGET